MGGFFLILAIAISGQAASDPKPAAEKLEVGPIFVDASVPAKSGLADAIDAAWTLTAPEAVEIRGLKLLPSESFKVISSRMEGPDRIEGKFGAYLMRRWIARIEPLRVGEFPLGSVHLEYRTGTEPWKEGSFAGPKLVVTEHSQAGPNDELRPIPPLGEEGARRGWSRWLKFGGAGLFLAIVVGFLIETIRQRRQPTPLQQALREIRRLDEGGYVRPEEFRFVVGVLADVLRRYLEKKYSLAARKQTTEEFLSDPQTLDRLLPAQRTALAEFLAAADAQKFAKIPDAQTSRQCIQRAADFLEGER